MGVMWPLGLLFCSCLLWSPATGAYYWMTYAGVFRPGGTIKINFYAVGISECTTLVFDILDPDGLRLQEQHIFNVTEDGFQNFEIQCSENVKKPDYTLYLRTTARGGLSFERFSALRWRHKRKFVFLQIDRKAYLPCSKVHFRALAMNPDTTVSEECMTVTILDPLGNQVAQISKPYGSLVIEDYVALGCNPRLGFYQIKATARGAARRKYFMVKKYDPSDYFVRIWAPTASPIDPQVFIHVRGHYRIGTPIKATGHVSIDLEYNYYRYWWNWWRFYFRWSYHFCRELTKNFKLDKHGKAKVSFSMSEIRWLICCKTSWGYRRYRCYLNVCFFWRNFKVTAKLRDLNSFDTVERTKYIRLMDSKYTLKFMHPTRSYFKPGLEYRAYVQEVRSTGRVHKKPKASKVTFTVKYTTVRYSYRSWYYYYSCGWITGPHAITLLTRTVDFKDSTATLKIDKIPDHATRIYIRVTDGKRSSYKCMTPFISSSKTYVQLQQNYDWVSKVDKKRCLSVTSNKDFQTFMFTIFAKGECVYAKHVDEKNPKKEHTICFEVTKSMVPSAKAVVILGKREGSTEIVGDVFSIDTDYEEYRVKVFAPSGDKKWQPGEEVRLNAQGKQDSVVLILGKDEMDQTRKNDFKREDLDKALLAYDLGRDYREYLTKYSNDLSDQLMYSGIGIVTNMGVPGYRSYYYFRPRNYRCSYGYRTYYRNRYYYSCRRFKPGPSPPDKCARFSVFPRKLPDEFHYNTWLCTSANINHPAQSVPVKGTEGGKLMAPDSIKKVIVKAFAVHKSCGVAFAEEDLELEITKKLLVTTNTARACKKSEMVCVKVIIHNNVDLDRGDLTVTLSDSEDFQIIKVEGKGDTYKEIHLNVSVTKTMGKLEENLKRISQFCIKPRTIGEMTLNFMAKTKESGDNAVRKIQVEPDGIMRIKAKGELFEVKPKAKVKKDFVLDLPYDATGHYEVLVKAFRDVLSLTAMYLDDLLYVPYANGLQNVAGMACTYYVAQYMNDNQRLSDDKFKMKLRDMLQQRYHDLMHFSRYDGSWGLYGPNSCTGSLWLTAGAVKVFSQAHGKEMVFPKVEMDTLRRAVGYVTEKQFADGSFQERGYYRFHDPLQGQCKSSKVSLTAYVIISLHWAKMKSYHPVSSKRIKKALPKAIKYVEDNFDSMTDNYAICIGTYALCLAGSDQCNKALTKMKEKKTEDTDGRIYWSAKTTPMQIEATSYALMALVIKEQNSLAVAANRWLSKKIGPKGAMLSSHDTMVGIEAISKAMSVCKSGSKSKVKLMVTVTAEEDKSTDDTSTKGKNKRKKPFKGKCTFNVDSKKDKATPQESNLKWQNKLKPHKVQIQASGKGGTGYVFYMLTVRYTSTTMMKKGNLSLVTETASFTRSSFKVECCVTGDRQRGWQNTPLVTMVQPPTGFKLNRTMGSNSFLGMDQCVEGRHNRVFCTVHENRVRNQKNCFKLMFNKLTNVAYLQDGYVRTFNALNPWAEAVEAPMKMRKERLCTVTKYDGCARL